MQWFLCSTRRSSGFLFHLFFPGFLSPSPLKSFLFQDLFFFSFSTFVEEQLDGFNSNWTLNSTEGLDGDDDFYGDNCNDDDDDDDGDDDDDDDDGDDDDGGGGDEDDESVNIIGIIYSPELFIAIQ